MNAHGRLLTAHSGFGWSNKCAAAPELCDVMSAQVHFPHKGDNAIAQIDTKYYPFLAKAAAQAAVPYINVEFFYQWGPSDGCHFACCGTCTNASDAADPRGNLNRMRKVMWDNYMAGLSGACWYHNDLGWDILDPRALRSTASEMASLRTLRDFWDAVPRRDFVVASPERCVQDVVPSTAVIHCLLRATNSTNGTERCVAMILHVRRQTALRPTFKVVAAPQPKRAHTYTFAEGHTYEYTHDGVYIKGPPTETEAVRGAGEERNPQGPSPAIAEAAAAAAYGSGQPHGFWLDPASTNSTRVPFTPTSDGVAQQPASFAHDAVLSLVF